MSAALDYAVPPEAPTLPAVRILPVPDRDPVPTLGPPRLPDPPPRSQGHQLRLVVTSASAPGTGTDSKPGDMVSVHDVAHQLAQGVVDVLAGHRPAQQLVRWARPDVLDALRRRAAVGLLPAQPLGARTLRRPVVRSIRLCQVLPAAVEAAAVVVDGERVRALAMRLEGRDGRWRLAALVIG